jgi:hypothetical protein
MEESLQGRTIRKNEIWLAAPPRGRRKTDPEGFEPNPTCSLFMRTCGLTEPPPGRNGLPMRGPLECCGSGHQAAGLYDSLAGFPREHKALESFGQWASATAQGMLQSVCLLFSSATNREASILGNERRTL